MSSTADADTDGDADWADVDGADVNGADSDVLMAMMMSSLHHS